MPDGQLNAEVDQYRQAADLNTPPPPLSPDALVTGATPIEQLLRGLGLAANAGDPIDDATALEEHTQRDAKLTEAADKFAAQDAQASGQMAQLVPQMASGIAGALSGAIGGLLQPLGQLPQQITQGAQQALQVGMGLAQQAGAAADATDLGADAAPLVSDIATGAEDLGGLGDLAGAGADGGGLGDIAGAGTGSGGAALGVTAPSAILGPPPVPSASTSPASARSVPPPLAASTTAHPTPGPMTGMPMVPPAGLQGAAGPEREATARSRRVSVPTVRNGAPVQGRITAAPPALTRTVEGKPVAARRVVVPASKPADDAGTKP